MTDKKCPFCGGAPKRYKSSTEVYCHENPWCPIHRWHIEEDRWGIRVEQPAQTTQLDAAEVRKRLNNIREFYTRDFFVAVEAVKDMMEEAFGKDRQKTNPENLIPCRLCGVGPWQQVIDGHYTGDVWCQIASCPLCQVTMKKAKWNELHMPMSDYNPDLWHLPKADSEKTNPLQRRNTNPMTDSYQLSGEELRRRDMAWERERHTICHSTHQAFVRAWYLAKQPAQHPQLDVTAVVRRIESRIDSISEFYHHSKGTLPNLFDALKDVGKAVKEELEKVAAERGAAEILPDDGKTVKPNRLNKVAVIHKLESIRDAADKISISLSSLKVDLLMDLEKEAAEGGLSTATPSPDYDDGQGDNRHPHL